MLWIVVDSVVGDRPPAVVVERLATIGVDVKAWKVAARDVEAKTVPPLEDQGSRVHLDRKSIDLAGFHQRGLFKRITVAGAHDAVGNVQVNSGREIGDGRVNIHQLGGEVRVRSAR